MKKEIKLYLTKEQVELIAESLKHHIEKSDELIDLFEGLAIDEFDDEDGISGLDYNSNPEEHSKQIHDYYNGLKKTRYL